MILLLYGESELAKVEKRAGIVARFLEKFDPSGMNLVEFPLQSGAELRFADVAQAIQSAPFLAPKRMVIIDNLFSSVKADEMPRWIELLERVGDEHIVVLVCKEGVKDVERRSLFKKLKAKADTHLYPFPAQTFQERLQWLRAESTRLHLTLSVSMQEMLLGHYADNREVLMELKKLSAFQKTQTLTEADFLALVDVPAEDALFAFIDSVSEKDAKKSLELLENQRQFGTSDFALLAMILRQIRLLLGASLYQASSLSSFEKEMGISPFVAKKALTQAKKFSSHDLARLHNHAFSLDLDVKMGRIQVKEAVNSLILSFFA